MGAADRRYGSVAGLLICVLAGLPACRRDQEPLDLPRHTAITVRDVRVRIHVGLESLRLHADGGIAVFGDDHASLARFPDDSWVVVSSGGAGRIRVGDKSWSDLHVTVEATTGDWLTLSVHDGNAWTPPVRYFGNFVLTGDDDGRLTVVNILDVERYVACVVAREVWPTFEREAFRAQAIAARTFVLYQMKQRQNVSFDVGATQGAQVYRGIRVDETGRRAAVAAHGTRGVVCTWRDGPADRLFCAYYSAACGGLSQSAAIFGRQSDVQPLLGGVSCDYCRIAPGDTYRWGPVRLKLRDVRSSLLRLFPDISSLRRIDVVERTTTGRATKLRITDSNGQSHDLVAERFRLAVGPTAVRSTDCDIHVRNGEVVFSNGRGFGHGLGLCQWGMQGQALEGKQAGEILRYYYPGSKLTRVY